MATDFRNSGPGGQMYETVIKQIRGVISARVVLDRDGNFEEIHILSNTERSPKQIVRDVETVIMVAFGISLDHKIISVVQMGEDNLKISSENWRPKIHSINTSVSQQRTEVVIKISMQDKIMEGTASGPNSPLNRMRMVSEAVLNALEKYFEGKVHLSVDEIAKVRFGGDDIVIVSVYLVCLDSEGTLIGASFIKGDEREAVCKATLNAVNRKISFLPVGQSS